MEMANSTLPEKCVERARDQNFPVYLCNLPGKVFPTLETPIMVINSAIDSYRLAHFWALDGDPKYKSYESCVQSMAEGSWNACPSASILGSIEDAQKTMLNE